jgi:hypothetical protein
VLSDDLLSLLLWGWERDCATATCVVRADACMALFHERKTLSFSCFLAAVYGGDHGSAKWGFRESEDVGQGDDWMFLVRFG